MDSRDCFYGFSLLFNIFAEKKTYYAGIMLDAPSIVLCSKLCRLNVSDPNKEGNLNIHVSRQRTFAQKKLAHYSSAVCPVAFAEWLLFLRILPDLSCLSHGVCKISFPFLKIQASNKIICLEMHRTGQRTPRWLSLSLCRFHFYHIDPSLSSFLRFKAIIPKQFRNNMKRNTFCKIAELLHPLTMHLADNFSNYSHSLPHKNK